MRVAKTDGVAEVNEVVATKTAATMPAAGKPIATKPSKLEETKAKNKKALADALVKAQAVKIVHSPYMPPETKLKASKPGKAKKPKLVRHKVTMPEVEYAQIGVLKERMASLGGEVKRSELMRAGIALLTALGDAELTAVMAHFRRAETKRKAKKA
ncbi:MAG: hypothetical protein WCA83_12130 [Azonexus sp.]